MRSFHSRKYLNNRRFSQINSSPFQQQSIRTTPFDRKEERVANIFTLSPNVVATAAFEEMLKAGVGHGWRIQNEQYQPPLILMRFAVPLSFYFPISSPRDACSRVFTTSPQHPTFPFLFNPADQ